MAKAPPAVVEGARAREAELADQVARLRSGSARIAAGDPGLAGRTRDDGRGEEQPARQVARVP